MIRNRILGLIISLVMAGAGISASAQSLTILEPLEMVEYSQVMVNYQNQFGKWNSPENDRPFPFAMIRMLLEGNGAEVRAAKENVRLYLGTMYKVQDMYVGASNEIWFLVPPIKNIYLDCGDGCERQLLSSGIPLRDNAVYICKVKYTPEAGVAGVTPVQQVHNQYLQFKVEPQNATVEVDGQIWQVEEGSARKFMEFGIYKYVVRAADYKDKEGTVTVNDPKNRHVVTVKLDPNFAKVTFRVENDAEIWIDDVKKGTGQWSGTLGFGAHQIISKKANHREQIIVQTISPADEGKTFTLTAPSPIYGSLNVDVLPDDAMIWLDGVQQGTTPQFLQQVLIGTHTLKVSKSGYKDYTAEVTVSENQMEMVSAKMEKTAFGSLSSSADGGVVFTVNGVNFTMIPVQGGTFTMGATSEQGSDAYGNETPTHSVTLSDYYIGQTEVTQGLWKAVMGSNPSYFNKGDNYPVEKVSWDDCQTFISKLNNLLSNQLGGKKFALPTEAQWEYAARGGNKSQGYKYSGSNTLSKVGWYDGNSGSSTHPVAQKQANELGIYDMSGNVYEWCSDWYGGYSSSAQTNPTGPGSGSFRVIRGGSWDSYARYCRVSNRGSHAPSRRLNNLGLRLVFRP